MKQLLTALALAGFSLPGLSQTVHYSVEDFSPQYAERFGKSIAALGDVNGDGFTDLAIGAPYQIWGPGSVHVVSGLTGLRFFAVFGTEDGSQFGTSVSRAGDHDGDGVSDLVVSAPLFDGLGTERGRVQVLSGVDGTILDTTTGVVDGGRLGERVAGGGDVDRDGVPDYALTQRLGDRGVVYAVSGANGALLLQVVGAPGDNLQAVADAGRVNADGNADLLVGGTGVARVIDGATGGILREWSSASADFGLALDAGEDFDGDSVPDVAISDPSDGPNAGAVFVFSGATGGLLQRWDGAAGDRLGWGVAFAGGDVDGDGNHDLLAGSEDGEIFLLSGTRVTPYFPFQIQGEGRALAAVGDVTGDGLVDYAVGGPLTTVAGSSEVADEAGRVICVTHGAPGPGTATCFGDGSLAACPCAPSAPVFFEDFEGGVLPPGWSADPAWHVTQACGSSLCEGDPMQGWFAYFGNSVLCDFSNSPGTGGLRTPPLPLPETPGGKLELQFKQVMQQDVEVHTGLLRLFDESGIVLDTWDFSAAACGNPTRIDLSHYQGTTAVLEWRFTNDDLGTQFLGWQIDDVALVWAPNDAVTGQGCRNSTGGGGVLLATGSPSAAADDLVLTAAQVPAGQSGIFFVGDTFFDPPFAIGNGLSCTGGTNFRYTPVNTGSGSVELVQPVASSLGTIQAGGTHQFQFWFRDTSPEALCPTGSNLTHGYRVTFAP